jgi:hypothetical protein
MRLRAAQVAPWRRSQRSGASFGRELKQPKHFSRPGEIRLKHAWRRKGHRAIKRDHPKEDNAMKRIATIAFAAAISTLTLSGAQAGAINGISPNGLGSVNGLSPNGLPTENGLGSTNGVNSTNGFGNNGLDTANGIILNGLGSSNGALNGWGNGTLNGISVSETAGQAILEIRLTDGTVARR